MRSLLGVLVFCYGCARSGGAGSRNEEAPTEAAPMDSVSAARADSEPAPTLGSESVAPRAEIDRSLPLQVLIDSVSQELQQTVTLEVNERREDDRWIFLTAVPRDPDGEPIDYSATPFASDWEEGFIDDWLCALLENQDGAWRIVALEIGATDVPFIDWPERFGAPQALIRP